MKDKTLEDAKSKAEAEMDAARAEGDETAKKALEEVNVQVAALKEEGREKDGWKLFRPSLITSSDVGRTITKTGKGGMSLWQYCRCKESVSVR